MTVGVFVVVALAAAGPMYDVDSEALALIEAFRRSWLDVQSLRYVQKKAERMRDGRVVRETIAVKLKRPDAIYIEALAPRRGQEVLYDRRRHPGQLTVHPGRFPDITLNLDIDGSLATKDQHHLITASGFGYTLALITEAIAQARADPHGEALEYGGRSKFAGRQVQKVVLHAGDRSDRLLPAQEDESLLAFARRVGVDPYLLVYTNTDLDGIADSLARGKMYRIPAYYARRTELLLDETTHLPLRQVMWDENNRLYEQYEFAELVVNPPLSDRDFDPDNPTYRF